MTSYRRALLAFTNIIVLLLTSFVVSGPSSAASQSGQLRLKGPGSLYSGDGAYISEAVAAGAATTFELQVFNKGTTLAQFNIKVVSQGLPAAVDLYSGTLLLTHLSSGPDGYYTAPIASGKFQALSLKVLIPAGSPQGSTVANVSLYSTDGNYLSGVNAQTDIKAPTYGTTAADVFAKQGGQPYIGGSVNAQAATSPAINVGGSSVFTVKLQNDGTVPAVVRGRIYVYNYCSTFTVKDGSVDVTAAMVADTYATPVLAVRAARTLTVTFKRTLAAGCGAHDYASVVARNAADTISHFAFLVVPFPAT